MTVLSRAARGATLLLALTAAACANQQTTRTGFLDPAALTEQDGSLAFTARPAQGAVYTGYYLDEVVFRPAPGAVQNPGEGDAPALAAAYRAALDEAFSARFARAAGPGPGVLRVRGAVTGYARANVVLNVIATPLVGPVSNGGAATEAEAVDSVTGARIAALATATNGHLFNSGPFAYYGGRAMAERALSRHARDLAARIPARDAARLAAR